MFTILIDTCVWLDLAKDYQGQSIQFSQDRPWLSRD
jgi:hypothetical protein